ncbi:MAG TPA: universal stress protein [Trebonia sp.]|nr:universal stress protein [Trebonia sp.]
MTMDAAEARTVIVGIKAGRNPRTALRLAASEARYRQAGLLAITAYSTDSALGAPGGRPLSVVHSGDEERRHAEAQLRACVTDALGDEAENVEVLAVPGLGGRNLVEAARKFSADLIVLSARRGSMMPGTVSQYVLLRSPCPVLVVPVSMAG